jgi:hypothetical protein
MRRITIWIGIALIVAGALGVLDALGVITVSVCGLFWAFVIIAVGVWMVIGVVDGRPSVEMDEAAIPLEGAQRAHIQMRHGAGRLQISAGAGPDELLSGTFRGGLSFEKKREGDLLDVEMRLPPGNVQGLIYPWKWGGGRGLEWKVALNDDIPLSISVEGGVSENRMDLGGLSVTDLRIETGASATWLTLPATAGHTKAEISCGAGSVQVSVPPGVAARIRTASTLGGITVNRKRFPRVGRRLYESPDYDTAANKVELDIDASIGSIAVG